MSFESPHRSLFLAHTCCCQIWSSAAHRPVWLSPDCLVESTALHQPCLEPNGEIPLLIQPAMSNQSKAVLRHTTVKAVLFEAISPVGNFNILVLASLRRKFLLLHILKHTSMQQSSTESLPTLFSSGRPNGTPRLKSPSDLGQKDACSPVTPLVR